MPKTSARKSPRARSEMSVDEAMRFLEDMQHLGSEIDEPTQAISLRVPRNVLRVFKARAKLDARKYQSVIVALMREWAGKR